MQTMHLQGEITPAIILAASVVVVLIVMILMMAIKAWRRRQKLSRFEFATGQAASKDRATNIDAIEAATVSVPTEIRSMRRRIHDLRHQLKDADDAMAILKRRRDLLPIVEDEWAIEDDPPKARERASAHT